MHNIDLLARISALLEREKVNPLTPNRGYLEP